MCHNWLQTCANFGTKAYLECRVHVNYLVVAEGVEVKGWEGGGAEERAGREGVLAVRGIHPD